MTYLCFSYMYLFCVRTYNFICIINILHEGRGSAKTRKNVYTSRGMYRISMILYAAQV